MNIKKKLKNGNWQEKSLFIIMMLAVIYLINELFIFPTTSKRILTLVSFKPCNIITIKCCYALLMIIGILRIKKETAFYWIMLNFSSVGVLTICYLNFWFYSSNFDLFLLEICSIWLLILINLNSFIYYYEIKQKIPKIILIIFISGIISFIFRLTIIMG